MKILITAGPTREAIDPVRYLSNRSSGRMGFAIAEAAAVAGHEVILIAGPVQLETPPGVGRVDVVSAGEMYAAVEKAIGSVDVAVMAAAVADYRPARVPEQKIKKTDAALGPQQQHEDLLDVDDGVLERGMELQSPAVFVADPRRAPLVVATGPRAVDPAEANPQGLTDEGEENIEPEAGTRRVTAPV